MPVSPARAAAFDILLRIERESSYASELLHASTYQNLSRQDHALATELVMGVLRWRSRLDEEIAAESSHALSRLDLEILITLRLALYQFRWLDRIPQRAALHESVELAKRARKRSAVPFVNAVLRKLANAATKPDVELSTVESLATSLAHPRWLVERWAEHYGFAAALRICQQDQSIPETAIRLRKPNAEPELQAEGITLMPGSLLAQARRVKDGDITKTKLFRRADIVIQDEASQLIALLAGRSPEDRFRILDCCAAPGSKTLAMADQNPTAEITAVEVHPHRARLLRSLLSPSRHKVQTIVADATSLPIAQAFDHVLADVPCSGTGTLSRNPEIKWRLQPQDLSDLHKRQVSILRSAVAQTKRGGRVVYSTCSLEQEENEDVVEAVLGECRTVHRIDCRSELDRLKQAGKLVWSDPASLTVGPYLRTIPGLHPCDGFFAAVLEVS
ncbi:MAG TPA: 16S rRNA (cytosine(967)-C(5))-methyltransferase RsmB [Candidatus Sulfotelmatobacter sp.]|nr:16S rRNA (cytosine(967)-C(5))-methyltransferase RsmB [Candidatus Sulfotelmatobacter sp.]